MNNGNNTLAIVITATSCIAIWCLWKTTNKNYEKEGGQQQQAFFPANASDLLRRVSSTWSPDRRFRGGRKYRGLAHGPFRGGDYVVNSDGCAATCSFCFKSGSKFYGVTVGHLEPVKDRPLFVFVDTSRVVKLLGKVVSYSASTDSLVFSIEDDIPVAGEYLLAEKSILGDTPLTLPQPGQHIRHDMGCPLIGYGAQGRGCVGLVVEPGLSQRMGLCVAGGIGIAHTESYEAITENGDCGTIFIDEDRRYGPSMHHILWDKPGGKTESYGVPLAHIVANHALLGGTDDTTTGFSQHQQLSVKGIQRHGLAYFEIEIEGGKQTHNLGPPTKLIFPDKYL